MSRLAVQPQPHKLGHRATLPTGACWRVTAAAAAPTTPARRHTRARPLTLPPRPPTLHTPRKSQVPPTCGVELGPGTYSPKAKAFGDAGPASPATGRFNQSPSFRDRPVTAAASPGQLPESPQQPRRRTRQGHASAASSGVRAGQQAYAGGKPRTAPAGSAHRRPRGASGSTGNRRSTASSVAARATVQGAVAGNVSQWRRTQSKALTAPITTSPPAFATRLARWLTCGVLLCWCVHGYGWGAGLRVWKQRPRTRGELQDMLMAYQKQRALLQTRRLVKRRVDRETEPLIDQAEALSRVRAPATAPHPRQHVPIDSTDAWAACCLRLGDTAAVSAVR